MQGETLRRDPTPGQLRQLTARAVVHEAAFVRTGSLAHVRVKRIDRTRTLEVELWWHDAASEDARVAVTSEAERLLNLWVWDGWCVAVRSSSEPRPDVVFDPYLERFVPRKAYRPLGTEGRVRRG